MVIWNCGSLYTNLLLQKATSIWYDSNFNFVFETEGLNKDEFMKF